VNRRNSRTVRRVYHECLLTSEAMHRSAGEGGVEEEEEEQEEEEEESFPLSAYPCRAAAKPTAESGRLLFLSAHEHAVSSTSSFVSSPAASFPCTEGTRNTAMEIIVASDMVLCGVWE